MLLKYFSLISYQRRKMLEKYFFGFSSTSQSVENYFFMVPYQRRKMLQSCFSDFSSTRQIGAELLLFDFLPTPQNAGELFFGFLSALQSAAEFFFFSSYQRRKVLQKYLFLTSYQRCKMLKNYVFGFLSALQSPAEFFILVFMFCRIPFFSFINAAKCS